MNSCNTRHSLSRIKFILFGILAINLCWISYPISLFGQATSRREIIEQNRAEKNALLNPEGTSVPTKLFDHLINFGLIEESGYDPIRRGGSLSLELGGMRSGSGQTVGLGYRYGGLWSKPLDMKVSARGTLKKAFMFDFDIVFPGLHNERGQLSLYAKYENSPGMNFFGIGPDSNRGDRTSYRLETTDIDIKGGYRLVKRLELGGFIGAYLTNVGKGQKPGVPSTEERFDPAETPGLDRQADFLRSGAYLRYDYRDLAKGPRAGGVFRAGYTRYFDQTLNRHDFNSLDTVIEQYVPYWDKTRVIAFHVGAQISWMREGQSIPFYMQPSLGGSNLLRGFDRYRFHDQNALLMSIEHRWYLYPGGYGALFFEAGKVAPEPSGLDLSNLEYSGGIGFRFTIRNEVVIRVDNAVSREGYRMVWGFGNLW